jgi:phosphatidylserine/phosphatidylglycerophosphate/cardiolipin synthase-like enzyme
MSESAIRRQIQAVIDENRELFAKANATKVEPGYLFRNGWITREPAIIVRVPRKLADPQAHDVERLPRRVGGFRIDVAPAEPLLQLTTTPQAMRAGLVREKQTEELRYTPIEGNPIDQEFEIDTPILCHASPDAGWPTLEKFLNGVRDQLTVAIYDFSADYIADRVLAAVETARAKVDLIIDPKQSAGEISIQARLENRLRDDYESTPASLGPNGLFANSYHTKVTVRDSAAFWLSSGNWSSSSQPDVDPFGAAPVPANIFRRFNRDWHVIVQHAELAQLFERYIKRDIELSATEGEADAEPAELPDLLVPEDAFLDTFLTEAEPEPEPPRPLPTSGRRVRVQPLLTPDNYIKRIQKLIEGAQRSLFLQFQYIHPSNRPADREFAALLRTVRDKTNARDFDARIIIGDRDARRWLGELQHLEFNMDCFKVQGRVHNKGIIVDGEVAVVGSHNWSADGTLRNRDASLILHDADIAAYYTGIFLQDWEKLAAKDIREEAVPMLAPHGEATPAGMVRIPWRAYYDEEPPTEAAPASDPEPAQSRSEASQPAHELASEQPYYKSGPAQGRPPEGQWPAGTKVTLRETGGSYSRVTSENGVTAFVLASALLPLQ